MSFTFLFCSERSGSNFITSVMGGHPEISGPPPSHMFRLFGLNCQNYHPVSNELNWRAFLTDFTEAAANMLGDWDSEFSLEELDVACPNRTIAEAFTYLYGLEQRSGDRISFVKENYTYSIVPFLLANWPDAKFVYQVRDPRDVAASWIQTYEIKGGIREAVEIWQRDQEETLKVFRQLQSCGRVLMVRYEDMVADAEGTSRAICAHLGLNYDPAMLEFYKDDRIKRNAERVSAWENLAQPVLTGNSGKYKSVLSTADIRYIELSCATLMSEFGYWPDTDADSVNEKRARREIKTLQDQISLGTTSDAGHKAVNEVRNRRLELIDRVRLRKAAL